MLNIQKKVFISWDEAGITIPAWNTRDKFNMICPNCSNDRKLQNKNKRVLGIWVSAKVFNCNHCGYSGKIIEAGQQRFFRPEPIITNRESDDLISDDFKAYLQKRGIDIQTALKFGCFTVLKKYQKDGIEVEKNTLVFPYNDNSKKVLFYKYRSIEKDFGGSRSPQYVFWQLENFKDKKILIVSEGEYDALSWQTVIDRNPKGWAIKGEEINTNDIVVTSIPNGISKKQLQSENVILEYFERCIPFINHFEHIYISTDNDEAGILLKDELARRFGKQICKIIEFPNQDDQKDANGVLQVQGEKALQKLFNNADYLPIEGVYSSDRVMGSMSNKLGTKLSKGHEIGIPELDEYITFDAKEGLSFITGAPNSAKSDFMFCIMVRLSLKHGWKWLITSPETGDVETVYTELLIKLIGKTFFQTSFKSEVMTMDEFEWGMDFLKRHIFVMESTDIKTYNLETFVSKVEEAVRKYGINAAVADPFNSFENAYSGAMMSNKLNDDFTFLQTSKRRLGVHFFVVIHPNASILGKMTSAYQINGGAAANNKADNIFILNRGERTLYNDGRGDNVSVTIDKVKKRHLGKKGEIEMAYHIPTGRFGIEPISMARKMFEDYTDIMKEQTIEDPIDYEPVTQQNNIIIRSQRATEPEEDDFNLF